jgi:erythromycin esterase-like protein
VKARRKKVKVTLVVDGWPDNYHVVKAATTGLYTGGPQGDQLSLEIDGDYLSIGFRTCRGNSITLTKMNGGGYRITYEGTRAALHIHPVIAGLMREFNKTNLLKAGISGYDTSTPEVPWHHWESEENGYWARWELAAAQ